MDYKIIENINPYNDIFYNNCFFSSFFPVVEHFGRNILHFLVNDIVIYSHSTKSNISNINVDYIPVKNMDMLIDEVGLHLERKIKSENVIEDIIISIEKDIPVIIWVDCFYESIRNDTYLKLHWPHSWLIFGFNKKEKVFNIIEHNHKEYLTYDKREISFEDTINCYNGFSANFQRDFGIESFIGISSPENYAKFEFNEANVSFYSTIFLSNMREKKEQVLHGLEYLRDFIDNLNKVIESNELKLSNIEGLVGLFNSIVKAKQAERYRLSKVFAAYDERIELIQEIISNWNYIRNVMAKFMYSSSIKASAVSSIKSRFNEIFILENKFYRSFYD